MPPDTIGLRTLIISEGDDSQLVDNFVTYLTEISQTVFEHMTESGPISNALQSVRDRIKGYGPIHEHSDEVRFL